MFNFIKNIGAYIVFALIVNLVGYHYLFGGVESPSNLIVKNVELPTSVPLYSNETNINIDPVELGCMAKNIFHEARNQSIEGQLAVAFVTMNRVKHVNYPNTVCGVVYEDYQFSWTLRNPYVETNSQIEKEAWEQSLQIALDVLKDIKYNNMHGVTHYHADHVSPEWVRVNSIHSQIDKHIFYTGIF